MNLTGNTFFVITIVLVVIAVLLPLLFWSRLRGPAVVRGAGRLVMVLFAQATAVLVVFVAVNNANGLYDSWDDLLGTSNHVNTAVDLGPSGTGGRQISSLPKMRQKFEKVDDPTLGSGLRRTKLKGGISGVEGEVYVWLPPQYDDPAYRSKQFPVVELLSGFPGSSRSWFRAMKAQSRIQPLIESGKVAPFILVSPRTMLLGASDHGYANIPGTVNADSWLTVDVRKMVADNFRVSLNADSWAIAGYSAGGHGAAKLALAHPDRYRAAVSLSGYNDPASEKDSITGSDPELRRENDVLNILKSAGKPPRVSLLATGEGVDGYLPGVALQRAAKAPTRVEVRKTTGGHLTRVWGKELPYVFEWLTRQMHLQGMNQDQSRGEAGGQAQGRYEAGVLDGLEEEPQSAAALLE
ncbi:esterase [Streptomyces lunaelactis]|uniref:Esterase n=1 Tax=Streptomyces lunaelactis TaxID=1535768 RepID=A0A2R4T6T3_9ACTN|nr:alpha/beta fold hydrolase [Streptomyces lunaelactis]AVZ74842.1 esterase [Streptomyces lunaelactis]NUK86977.1 alpha/beta fold hydrolase [Streptomyces lunaelactis]